MVAINGCCFECLGNLEHLWVLMSESWDHCNFSSAVCHCNTCKDQNKCWKKGNHERSLLQIFTILEKFGGVCTLQWLIFFTDAPFLKSPYDSVKMVVYFDIINLMENYMVVTELKIPYEE